jgi:hypothetical protein
MYKPFLTVLSQSVDCCLQKQELKVLQKMNDDTYTFQKQNNSSSTMFKQNNLELIDLTGCPEKIQFRTDEAIQFSLNTSHQQH